MAGHRIYTFLSSCTDVCSRFGGHLSQAQPAAASTSVCARCAVTAAAVAVPHRAAPPPALPPPVASHSAMPPAPPPPVQEPADYAITCAGYVMFVKQFHVSAAGGRPWHHVGAAGAACTVRMLGVRARTGVTRHVPQQRVRCDSRCDSDSRWTPPAAAAAAAGMLLREIMARGFQSGGATVGREHQHGTAFPCC